MGHFPTASTGFRAQESRCKLQVSCGLRSRSEEVRQRSRVYGASSSKVFQAVDQGEVGRSLLR